MFSTFSTHLLPKKKNSFFFIYPHNSCIHFCSLCPNIVMLWFCCCCCWTDIQCLPYCDLWILSIAESHMCNDYILLLIQYGRNNVIHSLLCCLFLETQVIFPSLLCGLAGTMWLYSGQWKCKWKRYSPFSPRQYTTFSPPGRWSEGLRWWSCKMKAAWVPESPLGGEPPTSNSLWCGWDINLSVLSHWDFKMSLLQ